MEKINKLYKVIISQSNLYYLFLVDIIIKGLNLLLIIYFAKKMTIDNFGKLSLLMTFFTYFLIVIEFGTSHLALRDFVNLKKKEKEVFLINVFTLKFLLTLITVCIFIIMFYNENISILIYFSLLLFLSSFANDWYFKSLYKNSLLFKSYLFGIIGYSYLLFIDSYLISDYFIIRNMFIGISIIFILYYIFQDMSMSFQKISINYMLDIIKKAYPIFISTIAVTIYYNSDVIMLDYFKTVYEVGIYSAYYKFVFIFLTIKSVIIGYLTSKLSYHFKNKNFKTFFSTIEKIILYVFIIVSLLLIIIYSQQDIIINVLFGNKYIINNSHELLFILFFTIIVTYLYLLFPSVQIIIGNQKIFMYYTIIASLINISANFYLISKYSFIGAAYSTLISEIFLFFIFSYKYFSLRKQYV